MEIEKEAEMTLEMGEKLKSSKRSWKDRKAKTRDGSKAEHKVGSRDGEKH